MQVLDRTGVPGATRPAARWIVLGIVAALGGTTLGAMQLVHPGGAFAALAPGARYMTAVRAELDAYATAIGQQRFREARDHLEQARRLAKQASGRAPASGAIWAARAEIEWQQNGLTQQARDYIARSRELALHEYTAVGTRLAIGLQAFERSTEPERMALQYDLETLLIVPAKHRIIDKRAGLAVTSPPDAARWLEAGVARFAPAYVRQYELSVAARRTAQ